MIERAFIDATTLLLQIVPRVFATDRLALSPRPRGAGQS